MKNYKAAGLDDICTKQLRNLGPKAKKWLLELLLLLLFNYINKIQKIPKMWRKPKIEAQLKPGKETTDPQNFRPISLLCHTYKIYYEIMLLNKLMPILDKIISKNRPASDLEGSVPTKH